MSFEDPFNTDLHGTIPPDNVTLNHPDFTEADEGIPVKMTGNATIGKCADGDPFHGVTVKVEEKRKVASVSVRGMVTLSYSGTDPSTGLQQIVGDGTGKVKIGASGPSRLVLAVDATAKTLSMLI